MSGDDLSTVADRLASLDDQPVGAHPGVLDEVHRALVGELDRLAGVVSGDGAAGGSGRAPDQR